MKHLCVAPEVIATILFCFLNHLVTCKTYKQLASVDVPKLDPSNFDRLLASDSEDTLAQGKFT